jgi:AmmeMemoRadiSam system protein B
MRTINKVIILLALSFFLILGFVRKTQPSKKSAEQFISEPEPSQRETYHLACPYSGSVYLSEKSQMEQKVKAQALIVSHHLLAKDLINQALETTTQDYSTVILAGPNHFDLGEAMIQTTEGDWKTKFGNLQANQELIDKLIQNNLVAINPDNFNTEHSVCGLVSFIRKQFPLATIVPLILKSNTSPTQSQAVGQFLAQNCQDCLLLISLDFSHEVAEAQAQINDQKSMTILSQLKEEQLDEVICDSLPSLRLLFSYLKTKGISRGKLINQSNSNQISSQNLPTVTSYITIIFP